MKLQLLLLYATVMLQFARMRQYHQGANLHPSCRDTLYPWLVCLSAGLFFFYEFFQLNLFDVINQPLRQEFNLTATELGWMSSSFVWGNVLFLLPAGLLLDRYSARLIILCALAVCIIGVFGFAMSHHYLSAIFFHTLTGVGNAFCFLACVILVARWFQPKRQALVIGSIVTMAFLGGMSAHAPFACLNAQFGWRNAILVDGVMGLAIFLWIAWVVRDKPHHANTSAQTLTWWTRFKTALLNPQTFYAGLYTSCLNLPIMVLCALWGDSYLREVHHISTLHASEIVSQIFLGSMLGCPLVGWFTDKMGQRQPTMYAGSIVALLLGLLLVYASELSVLNLQLIFFLLGFFTSTQVLSYPLIAENNPTHLTGIATGIASMLIVGGGGVAQIVFGGLLQYHHTLANTHYGSSDFALAMWIFPISAALAVLMTYLIHCRFESPS